MRTVVPTPASAAFRPSQPPVVFSIVAGESLTPSSGRVSSRSMSRFRGAIINLVKLSSRHSYSPMAVRDGKASEYPRNDVGREPGISPAWHGDDHRALRILPFRAVSPSDSRGKNHDLGRRPWCAGYYRTGSAKRRFLGHRHGAA